MANINDVFPSKYLRAADLGTSTPIVTIERVAIEVIKSQERGDERKIVVYFAGKEKGLVCNKTNANAISDIVGSEDTDHWTKHRIKLIKTKVDYQGRRVDAIRIEEVPRTGAPVPPPPPEYDDATPDESDVPF